VFVLLLGDIKTTLGVWFGFRVRGQSLRILLELAGSLLVLLVCSEVLCLGIRLV